MEMSRSYEKKGYYIEPLPELKERKCFQVNGRLYKTMRSAASKAAWNWILSKYARGVGVTVKDTKKVLWRKCECSDDPPYYDTCINATICPHEFCELRNRKTGYFARLHKRVAKVIISEWSKQEQS